MNVINPGSTLMLKVNLNNILIDTVDSIQFYLSRTKDNNPTVTKTYKKDGSDKVQFNNGYFYVPFTQEDTLTFLGMKMVYFGIQINFTNKSVSKVDYKIFSVQKTIGTELIDGNTPSIDTTESYIEADFDIVYVLNISKEELQSYVEQSKINADKAIEAATTAENAKNTVVDTANQVSADKEIVLNAKSDILIAKQDTITAKNEAVAAKNDAVTAKDTAVEQANSASLNKDKTDTNVTTTKQLAAQVGTDKTEVSEMVTESRAILDEQRKLIDSMPPIYDDSELKSRMTAAEGEITTLKEDLGELNKVSEKILSVSILQKCEVTDGYYWNFIVGGKETKEINENYIAVKIPVEGNKLIVYGEFQDWASRYVNNGAYTPVESTYISHNTQTSKVAEFYNIPTDAKYLCLSFYKGGLDTSIESINVVSGEFRQNLSYRKTDFVNSLDVYTKDEVDDKLDKLGEIHINKIYVATTGSDTEGNGTKEKPYATVLKANDVITDASEKNKYEIIVADGTYTDLQEKYKGQNGSDYQGVMAKSYVTYKSQSNNPEKCIFIWDGGVGYDIISNDTCTNKCFFHIKSQTIDTVIKGFKFVGSNLRYCLHFESNCLTTPYIENCIFDWHGRDFSPKTGPVIGMGGCIFSHITFKDCKFLNSQNDAGIQWHDSTYPYDWVNARYEPEGLCPRGAVIECIDCLFDNLNIQMRSQNEDRPMPCCLILKNCGGLKNVYPTIIAGGTKNYWKLFNQCSFIKNDLLTDATETTTYDEMTSIKTSTD